MRVRHFVPISRFPKNIQSTLLIHFPCKFHIIEIENKWKSRPTSESGWWLGTFFIVPSIWIDQSNWLMFFRGVETTNHIQISFFFLVVLVLWSAVSLAALLAAPAFCGGWIPDFIYRLPGSQMKIFMIIIGIIGVSVIDG